MRKTSPRIFYRDLRAWARHARTSITGNLVALPAAVIGAISVAVILVVVFCGSGAGKIHLGVVETKIWFVHGQSSEIRHVEVFNVSPRGGPALAISAKIASGLGIFRIDNPLDRPTVAPGNSHVFDLRFSPPSPGVYYDSLIVESEDRKHTLVISLEGESSRPPIEPCLVVRPSKLSFTTTRVGETRVLQLQALYQKNCSERITISIRHTADSAFQIESTAPTFGPEPVGSIVVQYRPRSAGSHEATLITSGADGPPWQTISLDGRAVDSPPETKEVPEWPELLKYLYKPQVWPRGAVNPIEIDSLPFDHPWPSAKQLDQVDKKRLEPILERLRSTAEVLVIEGHADYPSGHESYNLKLSQLRAIAIYRHLVFLGFSNQQSFTASRICLIGYGHKRRKVRTQRKYDQNRRVVISVKPISDRSSCMKQTEIDRCILPSYMRRLCDQLNNGPGAD